MVARGTYLNHQRGRRVCTVPLGYRPQRTGWWKRAFLYGGRWVFGLNWSGRELTSNTGLFDVYEVRLEHALWCFEPLLADLDDTTIG